MLGPNPGGLQPTSRRRHPPSVFAAGGPLGLRARLNASFWFRSCKERDCWEGGRTGRQTLLGPHRAVLGSGPGALWTSVCALSPGSPVSTPGPPPPGPRRTRTTAASPQLALGGGFCPVFHLSRPAAPPLLSQQTSSTAGPPGMPSGFLCALSAQRPCLNHPNPRGPGPYHLLPAWLSRPFRVCPLSSRPQLRVPSGSSPQLCLCPAPSSTACVPGASSPPSRRAPPSPSMSQRQALNRV